METRWFRLAAFVLILTACESPEIVHPTAENIPEISDDNFILRDEDAGEIILADTSDYDLWVIGQGDGELIGDIVDVATDYAGTLYVLDGAAATVRAYSYEGQPIATIGSPGVGPGEFYNPRNVSVTDGGRVIVVSSFSSGMVSLFERNNSQFNLRKSFRAGSALESSCAMNGHLYVLGLLDGSGKSIHKYTLEGDHAASFGDLYRSRFGHVQSRLSYKGYLACNEELDILAWIRKYIPVITGLSSTGDTLWRVKVDGFNPVLVTSGVGNGGQPYVRYHAPAEGHHVFLGLSSGQGPGFYVWYGGVNAQARMVQIDAQTGQSEFIATTGVRPRIIDGNTLIGHANYPQPTVKLMRPRQKG